ncbi:MAG TPA: hypothetical protein VIG30_14330 [Ktedonobacterales bacterium]|jgi:hypothetical protein
MLPLILAVLLGLAALLVVLGPLFTAPAAAPAADAAATTLAERERDAKAALQDVEFDYQLGNLAEDDYRGLRERYVRRALAALKGRYDREQSLDDAIEAQVRALRERDTQPGEKSERAAGASNGHAAATPHASANGHASRPKPTNHSSNRPNKHGGPGKNGRHA